MIIHEFSVKEWKNMKKIISTMCICGVCLMVMNGCQNKETDAQSADIVETLDENETLSERSNESEGKNFTDLSKEEVPEAEADTIKFEDEMCGGVMEIISSEKTVIVSRMQAGEDGTTLVSPAEGFEERVSVYFTDDAKFSLETGKADGSDVNRQDADFSSIQTGDSLNLKGKENIDGTEFLATEVEIIRVID